MIIIPAVNAQTFEEVQEKIKLIEPFVSWVHLDIADGTFTKNTLWHNLVEFALIETELNIELHLMVDKVEEKIDHWFNPSVKRIIFHVGGSKDPSFIIDRCHKNKTEAGIAISPDESIAQALAFKNKADFFQILGVRRGCRAKKWMKTLLKESRK